MRLFAARQVGRVWSDLYRFVRDVWGWFRPASYLVGVVVGVRTWSGLYRFVQVCSGCSGPVAACVLSGRGDCGWSDLVRFVRVCTGLFGVFGAGCGLCPIWLGGYAWSGLVGAVRICSGLFGFGRGASLRRGGRRWTPVGLLFCCVGRRYHGADGMGRGEVWHRRRLGADSRSGAGMTGEEDGNGGVKGWG